MGIESKLGHRFEEMKTRVIDKAMFGQEDRLLAIISWIDLYNAKMKSTYQDAIAFLNRYLAPHLNHPIVFDFAQIMPEKDMQHNYDNAFRIEVKKPHGTYGFEQQLY